LEGEAFPLIKHPQRDKSQWSGITLPWMSMGYELKVTPIQLLTLYAAIANNGRMMRPMLVSEEQKYGLPVRRIHPQILTRKVASGRTVRTMQAMLEGVVENGTARSRKASNYRFAGKTGTAHIRDRKTSEVTYRSSFVGYFPVEKPVYAAIVMIDEASSHGYYGSEVALPVFREVADYCFQSRLELFPTFAKQRKVTATAAQAPQWEAGYREDFLRLCRDSGLPCENKSESDWTVTRIGESEKLQLNNRFCPANQVPNVVGMGLRDALYVLELAGLKVDPTGVGKVSRQSVAAGTHAKGQYVRIYLE
jgi:cell division protein FtsI (penicillin-binding protein 3)